MINKRSSKAYLISFLVIGWMTLTSEQCETQTTCKEFVIALDMSDLDGCGIMFVTEKGRKLLPINLEEYGQEISNDDTLSISYKLVKDGMSICMAEDAMISLTCIEMIARSSANAECPIMKDPVDLPWSKKVLGEMELRRIEHIATNVGVYYRFSGTEECKLYKCTGDFICLGTCDEKDECETYFANQNITISDTYVIYVQDN